MDADRFLYTVSRLESARSSARADQERCTTSWTQDARGMCMHERVRRTGKTRKERVKSMYILLKFVAGSCTRSSQIVFKGGGYTLLNVFHCIRNSSGNQHLNLGIPL